MYRQSGQNQANTRSSVLKLKHPLKKDVFWSKKFVLYDASSFKQFAYGPEVSKFT